MRVFAWLTTALILSGLPVAAGPNLLPNGGFEQGDGPRAAIWGLWPPAATEAGVESVRDAEVRRSGAFSGRVRVTSEYAGVATWHYPNVAVRPGQEMVLTGWVRTQGVQGRSAVDIQLRSDEKTVAGGAGWAGPAGTTDWQPFIHRFTVPAGIRFVGVVPLLQGKGTLWFDDLVLDGGPTLAPARAAQPPALDGRLDDACWTEANRTEAFVTPTGEEAKARTVAWVACDDLALYLAFRCGAPSGAALPARVAQRDGDVWNDESVEIFLNPRGDRDDYYQLIVNARGVQYDSHRQDRTWSAPWQVKTARLPDGWACEVALPWSSLPLDLQTGREWAMQLGRNDRAHRESAAWSCPYGGFHNPGRFGTVAPLPAEFRKAWADDAGRRLRSTRSLAGLAAAAPDWSSVPSEIAGDAPARVKALSEELAALQQEVDAGVTGESRDALLSRLKRADDTAGTVREAGALSRAYLLARRQGITHPRFAVGVASPMQKVPRTGRPFPGRLDTSVSLSAARGETEAFQLAVLSFTQPVQGIRVEASDLRADGGAAIPARRIEVHRVGYVQTLKPRYATEHVGEWPDPLLPNGPIDVEARAVAPVWVSICVPRDARPGVYRGRVQVTAGGDVWPVAVSLRVRSFALPEPGHLATPFGLNPASLSQMLHGTTDYEKALPVEEYARWCRFLLDRRVVPTGVGTAYVRREAGPDGKLHLDFAASDRLLTPLLPRMPDGSVIMAGVGRFGWGPAQGASSGYADAETGASPPRPGRSVNRISFPATQTWAALTREMDGKALARAGVERFTFRVRALDPARAGEPITVAVNCFPRRWFSGFKLPAEGWQEISLPLNSFSASEGPLTLERLAQCDTFQFITSKREHPVVFLMGELAGIGPNGKTVIDSGEVDGAVGPVVDGIRQRWEHWRQKGWLRKACVYGWDEVTPDDYDRVLGAYRAVRKAVPDANLMQTYYVNRRPEAFTGVVKTWCAISSILDDDFRRQRQAAGHTFWTYVCCGPTPPWANFFIDQPGAAHRVLFWQTFQHNATGILYWETDYWHGNFPKAAGEPRFPAAAWSMERAATYREFGVAGDGWLLYPGPKGEPLSSVRLENIRDGIEDYEYLVLLRERLAAARKRKGISRQLLSKAERELAVDPKVARDWTRYATEPEAIAAARERLADLIARLE